MYIRDYYFRDELSDNCSLSLVEEWNRQKMIIENDKEYLRPNNRMTMNIIEEILESREVLIDSTGKAVVKCLNCSHENTIIQEVLYEDSLGLYTVCEECEGSFDVL